MCSNHDLLASLVDRVPIPHASNQMKKASGEADLLHLAGARGIEPRSQVLETHVLTVVLCPFTALRITIAFTL